MRDQATAILEARARCLPEMPQLCAPPRDVRRFVKEDQIEREVIEFVASTIQVDRPALDCLVRDRRLASGSHEGADSTLQEILIDAAVLVQESQAASNRCANAWRWGWDRPS